MQTQVTCPQCGTPYTAEIHQVVDSKHTPSLKRALLDGQLNVAVCPNCGTGGQLSTILLFHDSDHEMFMVHVPPQLNLNEAQREQMIGQLSRQVMDSLPQEERRAYMFQPEVMLNFQTFMERVLETEGVTKEMIERQKKQSELLQKLIPADADVADHFIKENMNLIDEDFFAMLQMFTDTAAQMQNNDQMVKLTNLRARLMTQTAVGRELEKRQIALHKFNRAAKAQGGLTPSLLLEHIVLNLDDDGTVGSLVAAGQQVVDYEFFSELTAVIENEADSAKADKLTSLRDDLLEMQEAMRQQSQQVVERAMQTLQIIMDAPDKQMAMMEHAEEIDEAFMYVLSARLEDAQQTGDAESWKKLAQVQNVLMQQMEQQMPPEIRFLNQLVRAETADEQAALLANNEHMVNDDMLELLDRVIDQSEERGQDETVARLETVKELIAARL